MRESGEGVLLLGCDEEGDKEFCLGHRKFEMQTDVSEKLLNRDLDR